MKKSMAQYFAFSIGNIIEWYDFSLSVYFVSYISLVFFPTLIIFLGCY